MGQLWGPSGLVKADANRSAAPSGITMVKPKVNPTNRERGHTQMLNDALPLAQFQDKDVAIRRRTRIDNRHLKHEHSCEAGGHGDSCHGSGH